MQSNTIAFDPGAPRVRYRRQILIVDDDPRITFAVKFALESKAPYQVHVVNDSKEAIRQIENIRPDCVILDIMMPPPDGAEIAAQMSERPELSAIPIVFLTAIVKKDEINSAVRNIGGRHYILKPFKVVDLIGCMENAMQKLAA